MKKTPLGDAVVVAPSSQLLCSVGILPIPIKTDTLLFQLHLIVSVLLMSNRDKWSHLFENSFSDLGSHICQKWICLFKNVVKVYQQCTLIRKLRIIDFLEEKA